ncbi:MAG: GNAT family N-acetyltransferase [Proteobacteria bacterium]|nr:GNAT family N-acetyltransferase [Pseudomonadota bacterium]MCH8187831.1 GNAT family N-acetyltransferase [Pseudomonadota bacterium]
MILRRAKNSDSALLFRLRTEAITMMYAVVHYHSRWSQHIRALEGELSNPDHVVFIAEEGSDTVGSVTMNLAREGPIELTLVIANEHRHRDVGAGMLEEAIRVADSPVTLRVHPDDKDAQAVAGRFGLHLFSEEDGVMYWRSAEATAAVLPLRPRIFNE